MKKYTFNSAQLREMLALGDEDREQFVSYLENIEDAETIDSVECPDVEVVRQFASREMKRHRRRVAATERRRRRVEQTPETTPQAEENDCDNTRLAQGVTFTREDLKVLDDDGLVYLCWLSRVVDSVVCSTREVLSRMSLTVCSRVTRFLADYKRLVRSIYSQFFDTPQYRSLSPHLAVEMSRLRLPHRC